MLVRPSVRRTLFILIAAVVVAFAGVAFALSHRTEIGRTTSPDGRFHAVTTISSWRYFTPSMPGQSSDQPCYVEIFREDGVSMGELPVDMIRDADVEWKPYGAQIKLVGGWDFMKSAKGLCWRWNRDQTRYTYVTGHAP